MVTRGSPKRVRDTAYSPGLGEAPVVGEIADTRYVSGID